MLSYQELVLDGMPMHTWQTTPTLSSPFLLDSDCGMVP